MVVRHMIVGRLVQLSWFRGVELCQLRRLTFTSTEGVSMCGTGPALLSVTQIYGIKTYRDTINKQQRGALFYPRLKGMPYELDRQMSY